MLRTIVKLVIAGVVLFGAYKAASIYSLFQFAEHMHECLPKSGVCRMAEVKAQPQEIEVAMAEALSCARKRQTALEAVFLRIPKAEPSSSSEVIDYNGLLEMCKDWASTNQGGRK